MPPRPPSARPYREEGQAFAAGVAAALPTLSDAKRARRLGLTPAEYAKIVNGDRRASVAQLEKVRASGVELPEAMFARLPRPAPRAVPRPHAKQLPRTFKPRESWAFGGPPQPVPWRPGEPVRARVLDQGDVDFFAQFVEPCGCAECVGGRG